MSRPRLKFRLLAWLGVVAAGAAWGEKPQVLETTSHHYRIYYAKRDADVAGEVLQVAEAVWPTLARAYDAYDNYQTIDIFLEDPGDYANGDAIYEYSRVEIYLPHLNWVVRGRRNWVGNVTTHEIAHVFSLRQKARLWIFDDATLGGYTFNRQINWGLLLPWVPLVAPSWWVEGIAQFESAQAGFDTWDSQRDMIVRDAWLTHSLPTLGEIETYDGDWLQGERVYNTGFAFLRYLRDRYGLDQVRALAFPKPFFNFDGAVRTVFGKSLPDLYAEWQSTLIDRYGDFQYLPRDTVVDRDITGSFNQSLAFSPDGRYLAWLGNGNREAPLNWIYWKELDGQSAGHSAATVTLPRAPAQKAVPLPENPAQPLVEGFNLPTLLRFAGHPLLRRAAPLPVEYARQPIDRPMGHSEEIYSAGLEFSRDGKRLLTTRNDWYSPYSDIWEYEFRTDKSEAEKWHRLTWNIRASDASYHPILPRTIVFSMFDDGSSNVAVLDSTGRIHQLTRFREGEQVYNPRFTPRGDSIYFTLGIGGREAIAAIPADAPGYDAFASLDDSAQFPDSLYLARGDRIRFETPLGPGSYRDLRFAGDTLLVSSNQRDGVFNVFARLPHDSVLYRLTRDRTQALEPLLRDHTLYFQGYAHQHFTLFRTALTLDSAGVWPAAADSLPVERPKKKDYTKVAETDEPTVRKVAWDISPYLDLSPQFLNDTNLTSLNLNVGLNLALGPLSGGLAQSFGGYLSKRADLETPLDYGAEYAGTWSGVTTWHQRFGWTPNLAYTFTHDVRHLNSNSGIIDTIPTTTGADPARLDDQAQNQVTYAYDMASAFMDLPLNGMRLGPGFIGVLWYGRYWNENVTYDASETATLTDLLTGQQQRFAQNYHLFDASLQRHFFDQVAVQWVVPAFATPLPRYLGFFADLGQWWTRYALDPVPTDSLQAARSLAIAQGQPVPLYEFPQSDFNPWQTDFGWFWSWSAGTHFQVSFQNQFGMFTHKFPTVTDTVAVYPGDDTTVEVPHPNLWVMPYRLGLYMMPGYPYSFIYRGQDVLAGTAMGWAHVQIDVPVKIRKFLPYPSPLSSLNKVQFSLMGDAGAALNRTPDEIAQALENGEQHLLLDYGGKLGVTFLFYHQIPMELYGTVYMPYNQLRSGDAFYGDWAAQGYASPQAYLRNVQEPRYFVGFTIGNL